MTRPTIVEIVAHRLRIIDPPWRWERTEDDVVIEFPTLEHQEAALRTTWTRLTRSVGELPVWITGGTEINPYDDDPGGATAEWLARSPEYVDALLEELNRDPDRKTILDLKQELWRVKEENRDLHLRMKRIQELSGYKEK